MIMFRIAGVDCQSESAYNVQHIFPFSFAVYVPQKLINF